jgi:dipeptidase
LINYYNQRADKMTMRNLICRLVLTSVCFVLVPLSVFAAGEFKQDFDCYSVVVGKKASADGSVIFAHNEDVLAPVVNYYKVPASQHKPGEVVRLREGGTLPQAKETFGYLWLNVPGWDVCDGYINEHAVAIGSDGCPSREETPELTNGGILFWLRRLVAERARSAREGVNIAGELIDKFGYNSSGRTYVIADPDEAWILAVVNGKHWVAQRVPDDQVVVVANCYTIQRINLSDSANFLGSPGLAEYAARHGWYDAASDGEFNFAKAFSNPGSLNHPGNVGRMWRGIDLLAGGKLDIHKQLPFAFVPGKKLDVQDVMRVMRDHYEGTEIDEPEQAAICAEGTRYSVVACLRSWLPTELKAVVWLALFRPDLQGYSPWYPAITSVPKIYAAEDHATGLKMHLDPTLTPDKRKKSVAFALFVALDEKARANAASNVPALKQAWKSYDEMSFKQQADFEKKIVDLKGKDKQKAVKLITDQSAAKGNEIYEKAGELLKRLE